MFLECERDRQTLHTMPWAGIEPKTLATKMTTAGYGRNKWHTSDESFQFLFQHQLIYLAMSKWFSSFNGCYLIAPNADLCLLCWMPISCGPLHLSQKAKLHTDKITYKSNPPSIAEYCPPPPPPLRGGGGIWQSSYWQHECTVFLIKGNWIFPPKCD